ncbi:MAG: hypothetical protein ACI9B9_002585, partial [Halioglobus sp.]
LSSEKISTATERPAMVSAIKILYRVCHNLSSMVKYSPNTHG